MVRYAFFWMFLTLFTAKISRMIPRMLLIKIGMYNSCKCRLFNEIYWFVGGVSLGLPDREEQHV